MNTANGVVEMNDDMKEELKDAYAEIRRLEYYLADLKSLNDFLSAESNRFRDALRMILVTSTDGDAIRIANSILTEG